MTDTPDFDKMSPEEIMKWMESLAVRQGVTEGLTTSADAQIAEVKADDERLKDKGEYIPFGMKQEDWEKQKAKEEEQKRQRLSSQPPAAAKPAPQPVQAPPPPPPVQAAPPPPPAQPAPAAAASDTPDFDKMSPEEIMKWMESLAVRQGVTEGLTTSADAQIADISEDDDRLKGQGEYIPSNMKKEEWERQKAKEEEQKRQRLASRPVTPPPAAFQPPTPPVQQQPAAEPVNSLNDFLSGDLPGFDNEIEEETVVAQPASDPVNWLASLTDDTGSDDSFNFNALNDADDPLAALAQLSSNDDNSMDWLTGLGSDPGVGLESLADLVGTGTDSSDPLDFLSSLAEPDAPAAPASTPAATSSRGEDTLEWLESMARDQGANPEELMTPAGLNVTRPQNVRPDGPGYTPYSFESASDSTGDDSAVPAEADLSFLTEGEDVSEDWLDEVARNVATDGHTTRTPSRPTAEPAPKADIADDVMSRLNSGKEVDPNDISRMFESFFQQSEQYVDRDVNFDEPTAAPVPDDIPDEALKAEIPDWLQEQMISSAPAEAASSEDAQKMDDLMKMFDEETPPLESFTAQAAEPASAMPDWLRSTPDSEIPAIENDLSGGDDDLPDWLQGGDENIFAESESSPWDTPGLLVNPAIEDSGDLGDLIEDEGEPERGFELDTSDRWVEALTLEEEAGDQLAKWYAEKTGVWSGDEMPDLETVAALSTPSAVSPTQPAKSGALKAAQLPVEAVLMLGEPQSAPDWLTGSAAIPAAAAALSQAVPAEITAAEDDSDIPDWLREQTDEPSTISSNLDDIPEWLREQVDDTVTETAGGVPSWLEVDDSEAAGGDDLPDWLKETMADEETPVVSSFTPTADTAPTVIMAVPPHIAQTPPPPVPAPVQPAPVAITPVPSKGLSPVPSPVNIDVASTLQAARGKVSSGDINGSLADYEMIVRANTALDEVVKDLSKLADHKDHKKNPALYRVLGDTLMRRGELKVALETYRKALHML